MNTTIKELRELKAEVGRLRSFVIGQIGRDPEGEYRPEFVARILKLSNRKPTHRFVSKESFLKDVRKYSKDK